MPQIVKLFGYLIFFWSNENDEPISGERFEPHYAMADGEQRFGD